MLFPLFESYGYIDSFCMTAALKAQLTKEQQDSTNLNLNYPYGAQTTVFTAGMIGQLTTESGITAVQISDGTAPFVIFADSFVDALKSGKVSCYYLCQNNKFRVQQCYDTGQTYAVNTWLTVIPSGTNQGKLTPAGNYGSQPIVGMVVSPPSNPANDDPMDIVTFLQAEAV